MQLEHVDTLLAGFFESLSPEYSTIVHSDHGGRGGGHGTDLDDDMLIPWMAVGPNIKNGYTIRSQISLLDTAPTIAAILGIQPPREWEGHRVDEIFQ